MEKSESTEKFEIPVFNMDKDGKITKTTKTVERKVTLIKPDTLKFCKVHNWIPEKGRFVCKNCGMKVDVNPIYWTYYTDKSGGHLKHLTTGKII